MEGKAKANVEAKATGKGESIDVGLLPEILESQDRFRLSRQGAAATCARRAASVGGREESNCTWEASGTDPRWCGSRADWNAPKKYRLSTPTAVSHLVRRAAWHFRTDPRGRRPTSIVSVPARQVARPRCRPRPIN